jgi:hypothetical protein
MILPDLYGKLLKGRLKKFNFDFLRIQAGYLHSPPFFIHLFRLIGDEYLGFKEYACSKSLISLRIV